MSGIIVDIGTGDGEFVYKLAKENPDRFIIGIEPHHQGLERISARVYKKPAKGGINNALFVLSNIEEMPAELDGIANQVFINFPWAGLLKGLLLADAATWEPVKRICKKGAFIDILFGYEKTAEENEFKNLGLPAINMAYLRNDFSAKLASNGLRVLELKELNREDVQNYPSSWAKKLGYGRDRQYFYIRLQRE